MTEDSHAQCSHGGCDHSHSGGLVHVHGATSGPMLWISLLITLTFVVGEYLAGRAANSLALISDAGHNLSDALALGLAAYAVWVARKPANARKTFGYHRVAILTALFNAVSLIVIGVLILAEAVSLFRHPEMVNGNLMIGVAAIAFFMNTVIATLLSGGAKNSLNMRAAFVHMAGDALSSLGVVFAGVAVRQTGWRYADPTVSTLIALFILYTSFKIVRDAADILLEGTPRDLNLDAMVAAMRDVSHVRAVHDLHTWTVSDGMNFLSCHVVVAETQALSDCGAILRDLNELLARDYNISHATIQIETKAMCAAASGKTPLFCGDSTLSVREAVP